MKSTLRSALVLSMTISLAGCATLGLTGGDRRRYESAVLVENPRVTGVAPGAVEAGTGQRSSIRMTTVAKDRVCFLIRTPNPDSLNEMQLVAFESGEAIDKAADTKGFKGEKLVKLRTVATGSTVESYEDKETVTHKDASGRVVATSDRPVTRTQEIAYSDMEACYAATGLTKTTRFLGLSIPQASLFGESNYVVAAWRFSGDTAVH